MPCFLGGREIMAKCAFNISLLSFLFVPFHSFPVSFLFSFCIFHLPSAFPPSHSRNAFLSSIFHLFPSFYLIIIYLPWWKIAFSARLSSTFIFHLPPSAIAWKTFLIPSYSEVYSSFLVCFPFKKHFPKKHIKERCFTISKIKIKTTLLHCKLFSYICNLNISYTIDKRNKSAKKNAA